MSNTVRISVVGAGSAQFSLSLVKDLCLTRSLTGSQICFMDLDPERLDMTHKLAVRYAAEIGADLSFEQTTDRRTCLRDADFVINTAYVKGHHHEQAMRAVVARHGYYHDGVNLGDFYQLRLALDIARDMEEICPNAWLIQSANPVFNCCTLVTRETSVKTCGLCHGYYGYREIAETIGIDPDHVTFQAAGLNHDIWLTHFFYEGKDAYPLIDEWIETEAEEYWRTHVATHTHDAAMSRAAVHQYRMFGLFPVGDTFRRGGGWSASTAHRGDWWYHTDLETKKRWFGEPWGGPDTEVGRPYFVENLEKRIAEMTRLANDPRASLVEAFGSTRTSEQIVPTIDGLVNDHEGKYQVNVPNQGTLEGIPDDIVVEVPAIVSMKGIQPIGVGSLPPKLMFECILPHWLEMERNLLSFKTGDRSMLLWNALDSQQTRSYDQAVAALEDLLAMDGNREMASHFKFPPNW
jgi:alpha-galactosidase